MKQAESRWPRKLLPLTVASVMLLSACASTDKASLDPRSWDTDKWAKCAGAMFVGLAGGGVAGGGKGAVVGGLVGAAACFLINAETKQVRSAQEVEGDYRKQARGRLPASPELVDYQTRIESGSALKRGEPLRIISDITAVRGQSEPIRQVREEVRLFEPGHSEPFKTGSKIASDKAGSGAYVNTFTVNLDSNVPQGVYTVETAVFINDKATQTRTNTVQLVWLDDGSMHIAMLD
jgi:hypothetical protein